MNEDMGEKNEKALKMAKKLFNQQQSERVEHNQRVRDDKIK